MDKSHTATAFAPVGARLNKPLCFLHLTKTIKYASVVKWI